MAKELIITLVKSSIGATQPQKDTLKALGLGKIGTSVVKVDHPSIQGMITKVAHLVEVKS